MKSYDEYKDSGIEWIGEIPNKWEISKYKYYCYSSMGNTILKEDLTINGIPVFSATESDEILGLIQNPSVKLDYGDLVIPARGNSIGNVTLINCRATCSQTTIYSKKIMDINEKFVYYYLIGLQKYLFRFDRTAIPQITVFQVSNNPLLIPLKTQQQKIASFLDKKTTAIDSIIEKKEKLIEKLEAYKKSVITEAVTKGKLGDKYINEDGELVDEIEMKDSGVEGIGKVPSYWEVSRVKIIADINGRIGYRGYTKDDLVSKGNGALTLGAEHIDKHNQVDLSNPKFIKWDKYYESPEIMVEKGDLLLVQRGSIGKVAIVENDIGKATINPSLLLINNLQCSDKYLYYFLNSKFIEEIFNMIVSSTAVPMISQEQVNKLVILLPNLKIQNKIVPYLKSKINKIDNLIKQTKHSIKKYKAYKKSLIYEAVTGKIDLRDYDEGGN